MIKCLRLWFIIIINHIFAGVFFFFCSIDLVSTLFLISSTGFQKGLFVQEMHFLLIGILVPSQKAIAQP